MKQPPEGMTYYILVKRCVQCWGTNDTDNKRCVHCGHIFYSEAKDQLKQEILADKEKTFYKPKNKE